MSTNNSVDSPPVRVAIVDDHAMVAEGLARIVSAEADLALAGLAGTVAQAVSLVERELPDVVLMDYLLPDGDGAQATERILARWPDTKIIMLSGIGSSELLARAIEAGCVGLIAKDRPWNDVVAAIRAAHRGESILRSDELATLMHHLRSAPADQSDSLTPRELEVLRLLARATSTEVIAGKLFVSVNTVRNHVRNICSKLGAHSKLEAVAIAARDRIIRLDEVG